MKCELCFDNDCLDLPSLTQIQGNVYIHGCMGYVILESMIWFDLIWIDIPNLTENNIHYGNESFKYTADLQATSTFPFHFHFHVIDASVLETVIREMSIYPCRIVNFQSQSQSQALPHSESESENTSCSVF